MVQQHTTAGLFLILAQIRILFFKADWQFESLMGSPAPPLRQAPNPLMPFIKAQSFKVSLNVFFFWIIIFTLDYMMTV